MNLKEILETNNVPFAENQIVLPETTKHVKIDVGLSYSAPFSQYWLSHEKDLVVFSFEPNPEAVALIRSPTNKKKDPNHGEVLEHKYLNKQCFVIPVALSNETKESMDFYVTTGDEGCSSFFQPSGKLFSTEKIIKVPVFTLNDFFSYFPWDKIPYIEYLKIDAQGADLDILHGADEYLSRIVYISAEAFVGDNYINVTHNDVSKIDAFLQTKGFLRIHHPNTSDPTYINYLFLEKRNDIFIYQKE
jgi:FkbM family methyltransferase